MRESVGAGDRGSMLSKGSILGTCGGPLVLVEEEGSMPGHRRLCGTQGKAGVSLGHWGLPVRHSMGPRQAETKGLGFQR